ncbi:hypothetical protein [uncultured Croceitalea sp.]|uniref:hypothetical protein n=1 Tax=uncultured Croceitalea sp. TaxID=1798908 RepID=UPI0033067BA2
MIKIERTKIIAPEILTQENGRGPKETKKAINHYSKPIVTKPYKFSVYSDRRVKEALITLFDGKCAYCESRFLHVYSGDVEHFRPKGKISDADNPKPGYYWLAADWENLLLSCRNCNQKLKHLTVGATDKETMGKMDQFPLDDGGVHVQNHAKDISSEEPFRLLINPCIENPEDYFKYSMESGVIMPKSTSIREKKMALESIRVYVLQRVPLVQARERKAIEILAQIQRVKEATKNVSDHLDDNSDLKKIYFDKILKKEIKKLKQFLSPGEEYLGLAKQIINKFFEENFQIEN